MRVEQVDGRTSAGPRGSKLRRLLGLAALGLALGALAVYASGALGFSGAPSAPFLAETSPTSRPAAPAFTLTTFEGERITRGDLAGKAVVLNFWASWCAPCRTEMPYFETTYRAYRERGVVFVGLAIQDDPDASRAFLEELGITYPNGPDEGNEIALRYKLTGLPTTVFITRDGKVARRWTGSLTEQQLVTFVEELAR